MTLVIDRSTQTQSLALVENEEVVASRIVDGADSRSGDWVLKVRDFIGAARIDRIVVGTGPGSFAGIRAALAFAQGWAIGSGCDVAGLPSACAYARRGKMHAVIGDARRGKLWVALFDGYVLLKGIFQIPADELRLAVPDDCTVFSPDASRIGDMLSKTFAERFCREYSAPLAADLAEAFIFNGSLLSKEPLPIYLNPAVRD